MSLILKLFTILRFNILLISKLLTLLSSFYFITQYQQYEVKLGLLRTLLPNKLITFLDIGVGSIGTCILLIPCTIIILSFLYDNVKLKILAGFLGIFGTLFNITRGVFNNTLGELSDFGLFLVRHIATLEQKRDWFNLEVERYLNTLNITVENKLLYIKNHLTTHDYITYDNKLSTLQDPVSVKTYAIEIINNLSLAFDTLPKELSRTQKVFQTFADIVTSKPFITIACAAAAVIALYFLVKDGGTKSDVVEGFTLARKNSEFLLQAQVVNSTTLSGLTNVGEALEPVQTSIKIISATVVQQGIQVTTLGENVTALGITQNVTDKGARLNFEKTREMIAWMLEKDPECPIKQLDFI